MSLNRRTKPRTQIERRAETEERVLEATLHLVSSGGMQAVTLAAVGRESGYSRGIVTHQFGTRDELVRRVVAHIQQRFIPPDTAGNGLERVLVVVDAYLLQLAAGDLGGRALLRLWSEAVAGDAVLAAVFSDRDAQFRSDVAQELARGRSDGSITGEPDTDATAALIVGLLRGLGMQLMLNPGLRGGMEVRRAAQALLRSAWGPR